MLRYFDVVLHSTPVLTSCLTAIKNHWIKYCEKTYETEGINYFWSIKNSTGIFYKLKNKLIINQLVDLIENTFRREEVLYLACNEEWDFFRFRRT